MFDIKIQGLDIFLLMRKIFGKGNNLDQLIPKELKALGSSKEVRMSNETLPDWEK